ncbi:lasso peptide biosynthesis B2 protein [Plantibacter elymi (nom. nud.)]|nr:lasso peptide biosynthesis B2 protein [Plantibacter sp. VKM Ac-1784]
MSDIVVPLEPRHRTSFIDRVRARLVLPLVFVLVRLQPARLQQMLSRMAHGSDAADLTLVERGLDAVVAVSRRCAGRYCLDRATATAVFCWTLGRWPEWHAGAAIDPFRAHAWVCVDGEPVREPASLNKYFVPMVSVMPRTAPDDRM